MHVDIAVIGGGIQGAGVAQAAAASGYSVLLVEKSHWGAGTSSKSSKLIHGGLRYLQNGQFGLVRESLRERRTLLRIAPHLVRLNDIHLPIYRDSAYRPWYIRSGLILYAILGGLHAENHFRTLTKAQWRKLDGLNTRGLEQVFHYQEAQTDDQQLTAAVATSAKNLGAQVLCPATLTSAERQNGGYQLQISGVSNTVSCDCLINATGPWANQVAQHINPLPPMPATELVQGTHLMLAKQISRQGYYLESPTDHRGIFVLPWRGQTLLGTTETLFQGDPSEATPQAEEKAYLLNTLAHYFPQANPEISEEMTGVRVLPQTSTSIFHRSREVVLATGNRYIGIYGGKLSGYRATAEKVLKLAQPWLNPRTPVADTATLPLP